MSAGSLAESCSDAEEHVDEPALPHRVFGYYGLVGYDYNEARRIAYMTAMGR